MGLLQGGVTCWGGTSGRASGAIQTVVSRDMNVTRQGVGYMVLQVLVRSDSR